jgi:hypothetical protein
MQSATGEVKASNASGGVTYSTLANVPKTRKLKVMGESKPMVSSPHLTSLDWGGPEMQGYLERNQESRF